MTDVSQQLSKAIDSQMNKQMINNVSKFGPDSVSDFLVSKTKLKKDIFKGEHNEETKPSENKTISSDKLIKILAKIAKDVETEEISKEETKEATGASSAGGYSMPLFGKPQKRKIKEEKIEGGLADNMSLFDMAEHHNSDIETVFDQLEKGVNVEMEHTSDTFVAVEIAMDHIYEDLYYYDKLKKIEKKPHKEESKEATTSSSVGVYDAPIGGGRKNPLQIDTPNSVYSKLRSVQDKNFPKYGGKEGKYVKIKDKCKKFPYCNQGDIKALEFFENNVVKEAINRISNKYNIDEIYIKSIIMEKLKK
jgi:hypothetical protein